VGAVLLGGVPYASTVVACALPAATNASNPALYLSSGGGTVSVRVNAVSVSRLWVRAITSVSLGEESPIRYLSRFGRVSLSRRWA
jgi:hypothetical protein